MNVLDQIRQAARGDLIEKCGFSPAEADETCDLGIHAIAQIPDLFERVTRTASTGRIAINALNLAIGGSVAALQSMLEERVAAAQETGEVFISEHTL